MGREKRRDDMKSMREREQSKSSKDMVILLLAHTESSSFSLCSVQTTSVVAEEQDSFICTHWSCVALTEYR